jgi:hypothetical protein
VVVCVALAGCYTGLGGAGSDPGASAGNATDGAGTDGGEGTGSSSGVEPPPGEVDLAEDPIRRLTTDEYLASVRDLTGVEVSDLADVFPSEARVVGFANDAAAQTVQFGHVQAYQTVAEAVVDRLAVDPPALTAWSGCDPDTLECAQAFASQWLPRAWRRPVEPEEVDALVAFAGTTATPVLTVVRAAVQSPLFVFRIEVGVTTDEPGVRRLTGYEIATRLSYWLWQTTPDGWLLDRAADGTLDTADGVRATAAAMLEQEAAQRAAGEFTAQWLQLYELEEGQRSPEAFPQWSSDLVAAMTDEVRRIAADHVGAGIAFTGVFTTEQSWATPEVAAIYGISVDGDGPQQIDLSAAADRAGILGTAAFLSSTSRGDVTNPVVRGTRIWRAVLCQPLSAPPPGVDAVPLESTPDKQAALQSHRDNPSCAACHALIDPIGLGLERYDAIGRRRDKDEAGIEVPQTGEIAGLGTFDSGRELGQLVAGSDLTGACVVERYRRFAFGRAATDTELDELEAITGSFAEHDNDLAHLAGELAASDAFRFLRIAGDE